MTIKQKIIGKSVATAVLVAAVGLFSALSMLSVASVLDRTVATELHETRDIGQMQEAAGTIDQAADNFQSVLKEHQPVDIAGTRAAINTGFDRINQATFQLDQSTRLQPAGATTGGSNNAGVWDYRRDLKSIEQQSRLASSAWTELQSQLDGNGDAIAESASLERLTLATGGLVRISEDFERGAKEDMARGLQVAQNRVATSVRLLTVAAVLAVLISVGLASLVAMPLAARLARLRDGTVEIGNGNLGVRIHVESSDEIGQLGAAFNEMAGSLKRSRDEIKESESRYRELTETIREVFWVCSPDNTEIQYISPAYEEVWGRSCQSLHDDPMSFAGAIIPEDRPRMFAALQKLASSDLDEEYRITRPDGTMRWIHARAFAVGKETGKVQRIVGIATDVTRQRTAEEALRQAHAELEQRVEARTTELRQANESLRRSETDLQHAKDAAEAASRAKSVVFDTALDSIVTIDSHGVIVAWNLQAETMFRWDSSEVIGMRLDQTIIPQRRWDDMGREIEAFIKTGESPLFNTVWEGIGVRRDGREFPIDVAITPAWSGGECTFTAFIRDIGLRKQAEVDLRQAKEAAENASRAKSEFLAKMSHEIRTPLNGVIGMSGLLMDTPLDPKQQRLTQLIKTSGQTLSELIDDLLDFSKIEARKLEIESVDFDLYAVVEDVTELMSMRAAQKGLELACITMPGVPRHVMGDSARLRQIMVNLISNAIKFTESGSISTRLTLDEQSQDLVTVRFSITDTGIGIPADRMDRLFKSFSQVDSSTTRTYGGTGLGLAISKQLAELMGGGVGVESTVGHGSTFWFTVKLGRASHAQESVPNHAVDFNGLRVLAMHHSATMREILRSQLNGWGLQTVTASTTEEAMKMLVGAAKKGLPYDVVILDAEVPATKTLEAGKDIKGRHDLARTALLVLLPVESDITPLELRAAGFSGHLIKPVRQSRLYDSIVEAMAPKSRHISAAGATAPTGNPLQSDSVDASPRGRILIAEDNRVNQIVASEILARYGYGSDIADNGKKAVAAVLAGGYDLVLMDCSMPEMDGFEATRLIRRAEESDPTRLPRHMPIIALTANAINGDRERCIETGMDDYVSKPIDPSRLIKSIEGLLAKSAEASPTDAAIKTPAVAAAMPTTVAGHATPPLGIEALLERCMGNAQTIALILTEFEQQAVTDLADLKRHVEGGDCEATARVAHALKGAAAILSADALSGTAFKLERMGRAGVFADEENVLAELNAEVRRCIDYLPTARAAIAKKIEV